MRIQVPFSYMQSVPPSAEQSVCSSLRASLTAAFKDFAGRSSKKEDLSELLAEYV